MAPCGLDCSESHRSCPSVDSRCSPIRGILRRLGSSGSQSCRDSQNSPQTYNVYFLWHQHWFYHKNVVKGHISEPSRWNVTFDGRQTTQIGAEKIFKGIVHQKWNQKFCDNLLFLMLFKLAWLSFLCRTQNKTFWRILLAIQWKSAGSKIVLENTLAIYHLLCSKNK